MYLGENNSSKDRVVKIDQLYKPKRQKQAISLVPTAYPQTLAGASKQGSLLNMGPSRDREAAPMKLDRTDSSTTGGLLVAQNNQMEEPTMPLKKNPAVANRLRNMASTINGPTTAKYTTNSTFNS